MTDDDTSSEIYNENVGLEDKITNLLQIRTT